MGMRNKICPVPWQHMEVGYDHNVFLCCYIPTSVGNLAEDSHIHHLGLSKVEEIWTGAKAQEIRNSILDGSYRFCDSRCSILDQPLERASHEWWQNSLALYPQDIVTDLANGKFSKAPWPLRVSLANERSCNLACQSCRNERVLDASNPKLDLVLRRLFTSGVLEHAEVLKLNGSGEFMHSQKLLAFVREALSRYPKLQLELLTNLTTFNAEHFYKLGFRHRVKQIYGSIDAATPETYAKVRGGNFKAVMRNLESFANIRSDEGFNLIAGFVVSSKNFEEMTRFAMLARELGLGVHFRSIQHWGHLPRVVYDELDVARTDHPDHEVLVCLLNGNPIFRSHHVSLGDFLRFIKE